MGIIPLTMFIFFNIVAIGIWLLSNIWRLHDDARAQCTGRNFGDKAEMFHFMEAYAVLRLET